MNQSFALTTEQYKNHSKTVTRRDGWKRIKTGQILNGVDRVMGFKKGEKPVIFGRHVVYSHRWEPLRRMIDEPEYGKRECIREGFPDWTPEQFVEFYCQHNKRTPDDLVNRISFRHILKWDDKNIPTLPPGLNSCPICEAEIYIQEITGMVECERTGLWIADEFSVRCITEPDIDSRRWEYWVDNHYNMPYVDWLPLEMRIQAWMKAHFRFVDSD